MNLPPATFTVEVDAAPGAVFDYFADPLRRPEWQSSLKAVDLVDGPQPRLGQHWYDVTAVGVRPLMETTVFQPGVRWAERGTWHGVWADLTMDFAELSGAAPRTRVTVTALLGGRGPWIVLALGARPLMPLALRSDVRRAGRLLAA